MSNDSMGNLEKLGILVIVILVVVVGVVAITPSDTLFRDELAVLGEQADDFEPVPERRPAEVVVPQVEPEPEPWPIQVPDEEPPAPPQRRELANLPVDPPTPQPPVVKREPIRPAPVETPSFREITVQKDDSLWKIADRELGKGSLWGVIARANPSVNADRLQTGQKLRIPLQIGAPETERAERPAARTAGIKTYTVKPGDTPMGISSLHYGTVRHYRLILSHNGLAEDGLQADVTIEIPPLPETSSNVAPAGDSSSSRAAPRSNGERFYEVQKGDVPARIAREQLGDERRWREILRLNGIADASGLIAGSRIRLPAK